MLGNDISHIPFRHKGGPEKLRFQAVSIGQFQISWLLTSPLVAHGMGSKDVENCYRYWMERVPIKFRGFEPTHQRVHRSSILLSECLFRQEGYFVSHDEVRGPSQFVGKCRMRDHEVALPQLSVVIGSGLFVITSCEFSCLGKCPG